MERPADLWFITSVLMGPKLRKEQLLAKGTSSPRSGNNPVVERLLFGIPCEWPGNEMVGSRSSSSPQERDTSSLRVRWGSPTSLDS